MHAEEWAESTGSSRALLAIERMAKRAADPAQGDAGELASHPFDSPGLSSSGGLSPMLMSPSRAHRTRSGRCARGRAGGSVDGRRTNERH